MSELQPKPQHNEELKNTEISVGQIEKIREKLEHEANNQESNRPNIESISKKVEQEAISGLETKGLNHEISSSQHPVLVNKQLKDMSYSRTMTRVRKKLNYPSRLFSKTVHSKILDKPSEFAEKTLARPSSLLGGAFFSAVGSSIILWTTKYYGYEYNYLSVILLFIIGMIVGLGSELTWKIIKKR